MKLKNNNITLSEELIRVHAHLCGDGGLYKYKTTEKGRINRAEIVYYNTNIDLINSFRRDMNKLFGVKMFFYGKRHMLRVSSVRIADYLLNLSNYGTREWRIPSIIKDSSKKYKLEWIKAFSHDDGCTPRDRNWIRIKSMNLDGLKDIKHMLDSIKIECWITGINIDNSWYLNIRKEKDLKYFYKKPSRK